MRCSNDLMKRNFLISSRNFLFYKTIYSYLGFFKLKTIHFVKNVSFHETYLRFPFTNATDQDINGIKNIDYSVCVLHDAMFERPHEAELSHFIKKLSIL